MVTTHTYNWFKLEDNRSVYTEECLSSELKSKDKASLFMVNLPKKTYTYQELKEAIQLVFCDFGLWSTKNLEREAETLSKSIMEITRNKGDVSDTTQMKIKRLAEMHFAKQEDMSKSLAKQYKDED